MTIDFNFFNLSKDLHSVFKGIAGSLIKPITLVLVFSTREAGKVDAIEKETKIKTYGLITALSQEKIKYLSNGTMEGRRMVSLRLEAKKNILQKCNVKGFDKMLNNKSYFIWNDERYNIIGFNDYINNNQIRFYGAYAGEEV